MKITQSPPRLTMREVGWFFFPLLLNVQMMSISHSVINAALARMADAVAALVRDAGIAENAELVGEIIETAPPAEFFARPGSERTKLFLGQILHH